MTTSTGPDGKAARRPPTQDLPLTMPLEVVG